MQRIAALVLIPTVLTVAFITVTTRDRLGAVDQATAIEETVTRTGQVVAARAALLAERLPAQAVAAGRLAATNPRAAAMLVGPGTAADLSRRQAATDAALSALGPESPVSTADMAEARRQIDTGPPDLALAPLLPLERRLDAAVSTLASAARRQAERAGATPTVDVLLSARQAIAVADATNDQLAAIALYTADPGVPATPADLADHDALTRGLVAAHTRERLVTGMFDNATILLVADAWRQITQDPATQRFRVAADRVAAGQPVDLAELARDGVDHLQRAIGLIPALSAAALALATAHREAAVAELRFGVVTPGLVAASGLVLSLYFGSTITRPFRRLAGHAAAIGAGDLSVEPLARAGPREITVAFDAFNDLVANLRLLEAKSQALAELDLEAPVLAEPLPGKLGASLQQSVLALSGSLDERDDLRRRLLQQATFDTLTGLHNRAAATDHLDLALGRARRDEDGVAVLHVDLDDFKRVNETHGNVIGDRLLCEIAGRLLAVAGDGTFVGRLGGDEFVVLVEDVRDAGAINELARDLRAVAAQPVLIEGLRISLGASVGIAFTWDGADAGTDVLAWAELAVHRAKQRAGGGIEIYDQGLQQQVRAQAEIEDALTAALPRDELFLQYQPVIDLATGRMSSVEALVRWQRPEHGIQPPDSFIPVAERSDLIIELDKWVMARAARQIRDWAGTADLGAVQVAINVSGRHLLSQTLFDHVVELLDATGLEPHRLVVEITETVLVNDLVVAAAQLEAVRGLGVRIALDDFGTGYTSITHLRQLPIDIIKIDRSFVQRLASEKDRTLLAMITDLGHHLGLTITAEGVETAEQYDTLRQLGCDRAQGYLMSRPLPADALEAWARDQDRTATPS
jgi:diguanylate cyclase (GGDEF)-like protein